MKTTRWKYVCAALLLFTPLRGQDLNGRWEGAIHAGTQTLHLVLTVTKAGGGPLKAAIESVDQGGIVIPVDTVDHDAAGPVKLTLKMIGAEFIGSFNEAGTAIAGYWKQGSATLPLTFYRPGTEPVAKQLPPVKRGSLSMTPCGPAEKEEQELCGTFNVPEDRSKPDGRKIALEVHVLPALAAKPEPDAVFGLAGGPGQGAVDAYAGSRTMQKLRARRDIVLVDQRGTGKSNPLRCAFGGTGQAVFASVTDVAAVHACRQNLAAIADLNQYSTSIAMDDVDEVRQALGYDRINVFGGSYGTLAALVYLRLHGLHVRSVVLRSVAPVDYRLPLPFPKTVQASLEFLFRACAADAECSKAFPNVTADFEAALHRFDAGAITVTVFNVKKRTPETVDLTRDEFLAFLRPLLYVPDAVSSLPYMIHHAGQGDFSAIVNAEYAVAAAISGGIAQGMLLSVVCAEGVPFITEADIAKETAGTWMGAGWIRSVQKACAEWGVRRVPDSFLDPVRSDVPALILSGDYDPATPPLVAERIVPYLSASRHVILKNGTHGTESACIDGMVNAFVDAGSAKALDVSCASAGRLPPFLTEEKIKAMRDRMAGR
jgi:pimeloyl-ACP methyl ester carboxylesterase